LAEPSQYSFELREVTVALIKQQGLHEGRWFPALELSFTSGNMGPSPEQARPSALLELRGLQLIRQPEEMPSGPGTADAAEVNPAQP
jgi:hypothetical protein